MASPWYSYRSFSEMKQHVVSRHRVKLIFARTLIPSYLDVHPLSDYEPVGRVETAWIGLHRQKPNRQLVIVQQLHHDKFSSFETLTQLAHANIARPAALYCVGTMLYVTYEYAELELTDLPPLSEMEVAAIIFQVSNWPTALRNDAEELKLPL